MMPSTPEEPMVILKVLTILAAGLLTLMAVRHFGSGAEGAKARVSQPRRDPRAVTRLRQDPRTGIYYPEK
jgi:hypothetical protein